MCLAWFDHPVPEAAMSDVRITSFEEFWPFDVREHSLASTRIMHFVGTTLGFVVIGAVAAHAIVVAIIGGARGRLWHGVDQPFRHREEQAGFVQVSAVELHRGYEAVGADAHGPAWGPRSSGSCEGEVVGPARSVRFFLGAGPRGSYLSEKPCCRGQHPSGFAENRRMGCGCCACATSRSRC